MARAFCANPAALTKLISASTGGNVLTQVCTGGEEGVLITNNSSISACVAFGSSSIVATIPTTATPATGMCVGSFESKVFWMPGGPGKGYMDAISLVTLNSAKLFATPGFGGS